MAAAPGPRELQRLIASSSVRRLRTIDSVALQVDARQQRPVMDAEHAKEADRVARMVAYKYSAICSKVDPEDAVQQAWAICMEVYQAGGWHSGVRGFGTVCYVAINRQLSRYLPRAQSQLSCVDKEEKELAKVVQNDSEKCVLRAREDVEGGVHLNDVRTRIRRRIYQLSGTSKPVQAACMVWLDGFEPREAAESHGIPVGDVYYSNQWLAGICKGDRKLRALAGELAQERGWTK